MKKWTKILTLGAVLTTVAIATTGCNGNSSSAKKDASSVKDNTLTGDPNKKEDYVITVADNHDLCGGPQQIAIEKGFFDKWGLKYKSVDIGEENNIDALNSGKIDASNSLLGSIVPKIANGAKVRIVTGLHTGCLEALVAKDSKITKAKDLIGKTVGVPSLGGSADVFIRRYLSENGIEAADRKTKVKFLALENDTLGAALEKGTVDVIVQSDPLPLINKQTYGFKTLVSQATDKPYSEEPCCVAYVSEKLAKEHPVAAAKYARALQDAAEWVNNHVEETAQIQIDKNLVPDKDLENNIKILKSYSWTPTYEGSRSALLSVSDDLKKIGVLDKDVDAKVLEANSFFKAKGIK
ncbi:MAG: ABC transporter substrate-binding protein [Streptococcaceae bacterium]|jgi:NitT/TauT family transport system substrate-binding protein|nr:ABC transporter substrate-binding protein [Streptococcaceae bacterium]